MRARESTWSIRVVTWCSYTLSALRPSRIVESSKDVEHRSPEPVHGGDYTARKGPLHVPTPSGTVGEAIVAQRATLTVLGWLPNESSDVTATRLSRAKTQIFIHAIVGRRRWTFTESLAFRFSFCPILSCTMPSAACRWPTTGRGGRALKDWTHPRPRRLQIAPEGHTCPELPDIRYPPGMQDKRSFGPPCHPRRVAVQSRIP